MTLPADSSQGPTPSAPEPTAPSPAACRFAALLAEVGVTHVVTLPDNTSAPLLDALELARRERKKGQSAGEEVPDRPRPPVETVFGTREGEVVSLASGLWLGGADPVVLIQNTGLLESGDSLRGTAARMGAPLLLLVTCRGFAKARAAGIEPDGVEVGRGILVRNDLDSVAHMTFSTLRAWGIPYLVLEDPTDLSPIRKGWELAHAQERPVTVLLDTTFEPC